MKLQFTIPKLAFLFFVLAELGCSSSLKNANSAGGDKQFQLRSYSEQTLPNGLKLIFIRDSSLPKLRMSALIKMGSWDDPKGLGGVSAVTARMLEDGTTKLSAIQVADQLSFMGAELAIGTDHELTNISASTISLNRMALLQIYQDILMKPALPERELTRRKSQVLAGLAKISEDPSSYADLLINQSVFKAHPYGQLVSGSLESVPKITRSDVVRQYFRYIRPNNTWLAVSGDFDGAFEKQIVQTFSVWSESKIEPEKRASQTDLPASGLKLVSKPNLNQTQIRWAHLGIERKNPDYLALRLGNVILGQAFTSRLNQRIRDDLGLTYGISSRFEARKERGIFEISTFCRHEKTTEVLKETRKLLQNFVDDGITSKELESAKALMIAQFPAGLETSGQLAGTLLSYRFFELPDGDLRNFISRVEAVTKSQVNEAIRKHIFPNKLQILIYSDKTQVGDALVNLSKLQATGQWPAVEVEDFK